MEKFPVNPDNPPQITTYDDLKRWDPKKTFKGLMMEQRMNAAKTAPARAERRDEIARDLDAAYREHQRGPRYASKGYQKLALSLQGALDLAEELHRFGGPTYEQLQEVVAGEDLEDMNPNALRQIQRILVEIQRFAYEDDDQELAEEAEQLSADITEHLEGGDEDEEPPEEPTGGPGVPPTMASKVETALDVAMKEAVTPPGREKQVKKLKTVPGVENPWAVAWGQYKKKHPGKSKKKKSSVESVLDAAAEEHIQRVEAAGKGKYPGGLNPPRWVPWSLREIWREAAERWIEEEGGDPTGPDAYSAVAATYQRLMKKHAPESPTSAPYELAKEKEPWKKSPGGEGTPPTPGYTGASKTASPNVKAKAAALSKALGNDWRVEVNYDDEAEGVLRVVASASDDNPVHDGEPLAEPPTELMQAVQDIFSGSGTYWEGAYPSRLVIEVVSPNTASKQASKFDGLADEIEVDGHPARILKRIGHIGGKEALRVELIDGPRKGDVLTAIEG